MILPLSVGILAALLAGAGGQDPKDPDVQEGLQLYQRLKYDRAVVALGRALAKSGLGAGDRKIALETLGFSYTVLGDAVNAQLTFHALLDVAPAYEVEASLSPRLRSAFATAKSSWIEGRHVAFELSSAEGARELAGVVRGGDPRRVGAVSTRDARGVVTPLVCRGRECRGERPAEEFWIDVGDHAGAVLFTAGPFAPRVEEDAPTWWLYAAIGAGAIAGAIAVSIAVAGSGEPPPGSLGRLQLP